jgi:hypothetical protein
MHTLPKDSSTIIDGGSRVSAPRWAAKRVFEQPADMGYCYCCVTFILKVSLMGGLVAADPELVEEFHQEMLKVYQDAKRLARYNTTIFLQMVRQHGGLEAARRLLHAPNGAVRADGVVGEGPVVYQHGMRHAAASL